MSNALTLYERYNYFGGIDLNLKARLSQGGLHPHELAELDPEAFARVYAGSRYVEPGFLQSLDYALECARMSAIANARFCGPLLAKLGRVPSRSRFRRMMDRYPDADRHQARREAQERLMAGNARIANPG